MALVRGRVLSRSACLIQGNLTSLCRSIRRSWLWSILSDTSRGAHFLSVLFGHLCRIDVLCRYSTVYPFSSVLCAGQVLYKIVTGLGIAIWALAATQRMTGLAQIRLGLGGLDK
jgi:hypothetical protein